MVFTQPLQARYELPRDHRAGADAAYWVPLLGLFTGTRVSEMAQLRRADVEQTGGVWPVRSRMPVSSSA